MSPKTLRKQLSRADQYKGVNETQKSRGSLCAFHDFSPERLSKDSAADHSGTPTENKGGQGSESLNASQTMGSSLTGTSDSFKISKSAAWRTNSTQPNGDAVKAQVRNGSVHPMPNDSNSSRILKSIEDNFSHIRDRSVYHAFKERQSPKLKDLNRETVGLKPHTLKVVMFPDKILKNGQGYSRVLICASEGSTAHHGVEVSSRQQQPHGTGESQNKDVPFFLSNRGNIPQAFVTDKIVPMTTMQIGDVVMKPGEIDAMSCSLTEATDADSDSGSKGSSIADSPKVSSPPGSLDRKTHRLCLDEQQDTLVDNHHIKLEPPHSLNVREVAKLSKGVFAFPSTGMSAESIGPCSLDVSSISTGKIQFIKKSVALVRELH